MILGVELFRIDVKVFAEIELIEYNVTSIGDVVKIIIIYDKGFDISFCNKY